MSQERHRHEGHVHPEQEDGARGGDGQRGGQPGERSAVRDFVDVDRQAAVGVATFASTQDAHLAAHRAETRDGVVEQRPGAPPQQRLVASHPAALAARDHEPDHHIRWDHPHGRRDHDRRLNDQVTWNSAAGAPSGPCPMDVPT